MPSTSVTIHATEGGEFDCYLASPRGGDAAPHGIDARPLKRGPFTIPAETDDRDRAYPPPVRRPRGDL